MWKHDWNILSILVDTTVSYALQGNHMNTRTFMWCVYYATSIAIVSMEKLLKLRFRKCFFFLPTEQFRTAGNLTWLMSEDVILKASYMFWVLLPAMNRSCGKSNAMSTTVAHWCPHNEIHLNLPPWGHVQGSPQGTLAGFLTELCCVVMLIMFCSSYF